MYEYSYETSPQIPAGSTQFLLEIFKIPSRQLKVKYGLFFISGNSFYSSKKVEEINIVKSRNRNVDYTITISKCIKDNFIKDEDLKKNKNLIELIIKDILLANPNIKRFEDVYILQNESKLEKPFIFYPGYKVSMIETDRGNLLNVVPAHKLTRSETILDFIKTNKYNKDLINSKLVGCSFKFQFAKRHYIIDEIFFDRNPSNQKINYEGESNNFIDYYQKAYNAEIKDLNQPLILVRKKGSNDEQINLYFVPEFCNLTNIEEEEISNSNFLQNISVYTKLNPNEKVESINNFLNLLQDETENKLLENMSSKKKYNEYGINIIPLGLIQAYYMKKTEFANEGNKKIDASKFSGGRDKVSLIKIISPVNWVLFYEKNEDNNEGYIIEKLKAASGKYGLTFNEPTKIEMSRDDNAQQWIDKANEYFGEGKKENDFALFLLGNNSNYLYPKLKVHSLCTNGFISQIIKLDTLWEADKDRTIMSICSKILLQINA